MCVRFKLLLIVTFFSFSGIVYSQAPGCPNVDAGPDQDLDCSTGDCADLSANFLETGSTTSYTVTSIPYAPPFGFFGGTQVSANTDDVWSPVINLPFTFCFYGNTYTQAIVGSNGVVSFDVSNAGGFCPYSFSSQIPDSNFPILNAIYGVYMDIDPRVQNSQGQIPQINYSVLGTAPCRTLVINYPQVPYFSCNSQELTSQIVLYETTNVVEVYTRQRTSGCSFNQGNALIGIQNASGTQAVAAPGRNTSDWAASFEAWRFTPSGPPNYVFSWLDSGGNVLSNNRDYTHCVTAPETLTAEVVYTNCDGTVITETDTVFIDYDANVTLDLGPDQDVCDNQVPITLDGTVSVAATYQWFENNVAIPGATNPTYDVTTTGTYRVEVDANGCDVSDQVDVNVSTVPDVFPVPTTSVCDDQSNDGVESFDLTSNDAVVLGGQDPNQFSVTYHISQADADNAANSLTSPYQNTSNPQVIFARVENTNNIECYNTTSFQIEVLTSPVANQANDLERCDDAGNDDVDNWDLTVNEADILGAQNPADFSLSYHLSQTDADNGAAAIATPTAYQNTANPQTIYVRVENVNDATCVATITFDLVLFDQPTANPVADEAVCDDQSNNGTEDFDLDTYTADVLGAQDPNLYTVSYHNTQADADTGSNALTSPYANVASPETIFVRIVNANNPDCYDTTSFQIEVLFTPIANQSSDLERCDDMGNDDVDTWDLTVNEADILGAQNPADFSLSYHLSQADADNGTAAIATPTAYQNTANPQTIYVRVENVNDATCVATTTFDLVLFDQPTANPVANVAVCDDQSNDGTEDFDLDAYTADVLGAQDPNLYTVSYHNTQADADTGSNTLTSPYANTSSPEAIFVRIANNDNPDCFDTTNFDITVNPVPVANATNDLERCDDAGNDDVDIWDLTVNEGDILGAQNPADFSLSYHLTQNDADSGNNAIASPANFSNTSNPQTIYVRVENNSNEACQGFTSFDLILYEQAVASTATNEEVCDDEGNTGVATFDLSLKDNEIRQQDPNLFMVEYFASQADADAGTNPLSSPYTTSGAVETIYARVTNMGSTECYDTTSFDLIINPLPDISDGESFVFCDDLSDDGTENVDISDNETTILNGLDPSDFTITYYDDQQNAEDGTGDISPDYDLTVADSPVTIFVRVENNATGCFSLADFDISLRAIPSAQEVDDLILCDEEGDETAGFALSERNADITGGDSTLTVTYHASLSHAVDGTSPLDENSYQNTTNPEQVFYRVQDEDACFNVGDFELFVQPLPTIFSMDNLEQCVDENGEAEFDLSVAGDQAVGSQTDVTASYYLTESDAREEVNAVSTPFTAMEDTEIFIRVEFDDTGCAAVDSFMALAFPLPPASLENEYVFCTDQFGNFIVGPAELDTGLRSARYDLTWFFEEEEIVGEDGVLLEATEAGVYSVDIINTDTGCAITLTTTVREAGAPDDYTIEIQNGGATDNRTVIVEAIGPDEYWYRLDNGPYVNTGRFEDVRPGTHTITIAERNGCAEIQEEIFILGFPQFFTPNGDGFNDFWNVVEGGELDEASLYIFDRYGKLIKQIDPRSVGWDGTYNGNPLPSSDYWFLLEYRDGDSTGELRGHFALKR